MYKIISNYKGVNFTSALSVIRVSLSHGTARDIVDSELYSSKGIINCFKTITAGTFQDSFADRISFSYDSITYAFPVITKDIASCHDIISIGL